MPNRRRSSCIGTYGRLLMKRRSWGAVQPLERSAWPFPNRFAGFIGIGAAAGVGDDWAGAAWATGLALGTAFTGATAFAGAAGATAFAATTGFAGTPGFAGAGGFAGATAFAGVGGGGATVTASCRRTCSGGAVSEAVAGRGSGPAGRGPS